MKQHRQVVLGAVVRFLCACSGTRGDILARAPQGRAQAATLGLLLILTATVASWTSGYALHEAFLGSRLAGPLAVGGGLTWGLIVFCIDRLLVLGIDKFASAWRLAVQVAVRLPLALIIAQVMSTPLTLRVCATVLDGELRAQEQEALRNESAANHRAADLPRIRERLSGLEEQIRDEERRLRGEPDSPEYRLSHDALLAAKAKHASVKAKNDANIAGARQALAQLEAARQVRELQADESARVSTLTDNIKMWRAETAAAATAVTQAEKAKAEAHAAWIRLARRNLGQLEQKRAAAEQKDGHKTEQVDAQNAEAASALADIYAPNLINHYRALRQITANRQHPNAQALKTAVWGLDLLFFMLEVTPVLLKVLAKRNGLDSELAAAEFVERDASALYADAEVTRMHEAVDAALEIEHEAIEAWRSAQLAAITAGVTTQSLRRLRREAADMTNIAARFGRATTTGHVPAEQNGHGPGGLP